MADTSILDRAEACYREAMQRSLVPEHLRDGLARYLVHFIRPGDFLTAVLSNDLKEAVNRSDEESRRGLVNLVQFLMWDVPGTCWGSPDRVAAWLANLERA